MPRYWSRHDEAQYKAILRSCRSGAKTCRRIAAATVNKRRSSGLGDPPEAHAVETQDKLRQIARRASPTTCKAATEVFALAAQATDDARHSGDRRLIRAADMVLHAAKKRLGSRCRDAGLGAVVPMATQGFKDGRKSWIVVKPKYGPPMRVTHEVLAELGALPPPVPPPSARKCVAWRYVAGGRKCALFSDETGFRTAKPPARPLNAVFGG